MDGFLRAPSMLLAWAKWERSSRICFACAASSRPEAFARLSLRGSHPRCPTAPRVPSVEIEIRAARHTCAQGPSDHSEIMRNPILTLSKLMSSWRAVQRLSRKSRCED